MRLGVSDAEAGSRPQRQHDADYFQAKYGKYLDMGGTKTQYQSDTKPDYR